MGRQVCGDGLGDGQRRHPRQLGRLHGDRCGVVAVLGSLVRPISKAGRSKAGSAPAAWAFWMACVNQVGDVVANQLEFLPLISVNVSLAQDPGQQIT